MSEKRELKREVLEGEERPNPLRWWALAALSQFMLVLYATVVNVALPYIERDLGMGPAGLAWVVNGYVLTFGGLLLLGAGLPISSSAGASSSPVWASSRWLRRQRGSPSARRC